MKNILSLLILCAFATTQANNCPCYTSWCTALFFFFYIFVSENYQKKHVQLRGGLDVIHARQDVDMKK